MTIDEAIERLEKFRDVDGWGLSPDILNSVNLGIEALKRVKSIRETWAMPAKQQICFINQGLPGETES